MTRSPSPQQGSRKRGRVACITCRQAKVKCNLVTIPCTRCTKLQLDCSVNPAFKRTNKRDKVNELEDDVQRLKCLVETQQNSQSEIHAQISASPLATEGDRPTTPGHVTHHLHASLQASQTSRQLRSESGIRTSWSLGMVTLGTSDVEKLFTIYFDKYNPLFRIVEPSRTSAEIFEAYSPLFWVIVSVALRSYKQDTDLLDKLIPMLCEHLWAEAGSSKKNVVGVDASNLNEVQAMLILATWPPPNVRLWSDRSLIMSNAAMTSAMHIGLHRPGFDFEYNRDPALLNERSFQERSSAWVACYCLCISLALESGHIPLVPANDWIINKVCMRPSQVYVPDEIRHFAIISKQANEAFQTLAQLNDNPAAVAQESSFFATMSGLENAMVQMVTLHRHEMSLTNKLRSQGTVLLLQMMYFLSDQHLESSKQGVLRAYATATILISDLIEEDDNDTFLAHAPYNIMRVILRASFTILRTLFSSHGKGLDLASGKLLYNTSALLLRHMAVKHRNQDQPIRVSNALKQTWKYSERTPELLEKPPLLKIRSRMAVSLQYDCLMFYRDAVRTASDDVKRHDPQLGDGQLLTPALISSQVDTPGSNSLDSHWSPPSYEAFLATDLSWLDDLVEPSMYSAN